MRTFYMKGKAESELNQKVKSPNIPQTCHKSQSLININSRIYFIFLIISIFRYAKEQK